MKKFSFLFIVAVAIVFFIQINNSYSAGKDWLKFDEGMAKAKKENKSVLVDFYTDWCHWCKEMDNKTFKEAAVAKKLKDKFVTVRLNAEDANETVTYQDKKYSNVELTRHFGVRGFPTLAFLDSNGQVISMVPGFVPADTFIQVLDYIDKKCWQQDVSFDDFVKNGDCTPASSGS